MVKNLIKLGNPILINNSSVSELKYDYEEITNDLYLEACMRASKVNSTTNFAMVKEIDNALHLNLGKAAVIAVNPDVTWEDLSRIKGRDLLALSAVGRFFITGRDASAGKTSEQASEPTAESTTQAPETSEE